MRLLLLSATLACLTLAGCSKQSLPPETDPAQGREVLKTVLETWKRGGTVEELKAVSPPITAYDPDWGAGAKLTGYEIAPEDKRAGVDLLLSVKLSLVRPDGRPQEKKVKYVVAIGSATAVLRSE